MPEEDSKERATTARRGRQCARPVAVSTGPGEQGASTMGGAPITFKPCGRPVRENEVYCEEHGNSSILSGNKFPADGLHIFRPDELTTDRGRHFNWYARPEDEPARGRPIEGITDREEIIDAELAEVPYIRLTPEEYSEMVADGRWAAILAAAPKPGTRAWQHMRARLAGRARGVNTAAQAALYDVSEQTIRDWRKTWANAPIGREADLRLATTADLEAHTEALRAHIDTRTAEILAILVEADPGNPAVSDAINNFVDAATSAVNIDVK
jgi:hypothetical protein